MRPWHPQCGDVAMRSNAANTTLCSEPVSTLTRSDIPSAAHPVPTCTLYCMDARAGRQHHASVHVLPHIKKLDDCFSQFLVRVICDCGACREIEPEALARLVGCKVTLKDLALRVRCSRCGKKAAEVVAVARPRPRGVPRNPR